MKKKSKKLMSNTLLFFIGNLGSKFIQFFMVPLYTYTLTTAEYGTTDLVFTTVNFLIPIFSIQISDGLLRFGLDKNNNNQDLLKSSMYILMFSTILSIIFSPLLALNSGLKEWIFFFVLILNLKMYRDIFSIMLKVEDKNKIYAIDSILYTLVLSVFSIIFLVFLKLKIVGYFLAYVVANVFSIIFILISGKYSYKILLRKKNKKLIKSLIMYSLPLIINSISYWITTASDRYMINIFMDASAVGLYAIATKIPSLLTTFTGIFSQAWMISSISEYENDRDKNFYSQTLKNYLALSFIAGAGLIFVVKPFMMIYVSNEYLEAWKFAPILILSAIYSGISAFLNGIYYAYKRNLLITTTTFIGAAINIGMNLFLIPIFGIMGASIATLISWIIISIFRFVNLKKFIILEIDYRNINLCTILILIEIIAIEYSNGFAFLIGILALVGIIFLCREILITIGEIVLKKIKGIRGKNEF